MAKTGRRWANLAVAIVSIAACLLVAEVGLRIAGFEFDQFHQPDVTVGWSLRPHRQGWWRSEGTAHVSINSHGQRDREHALHKPPGTIRIAVLGDSFAEALQVPVDTTFWSVMESRLNACGAFRDRVEAINFGVSGYGTAQQLLQLRSRVWSFSPDIVLLAVFTGNDVANNSRRLEPISDRPFFVLREGTLVHDDSFSKRTGLRISAGVVGSVYRWLGDHLRTLQLLQFARSRASLLIATPAKRGDDTLADLRMLDMRPELYRPAPGDDWLEAWRITGGILEGIRDEATGNGAELVVVTLSNDIQVHPDRVTRERVAKQIGADSLFRPDDAIRDITDRLGIRHIALARAMQRESERTGKLLHGFDGSGLGHWNEEGHRVAGLLIAESLCERAR
jgi:hypothetical protein